ncbi:MAG: GGDEF domain-containing protein [Acidimicrobiia bacterium]
MSKYFSWGSAGSVACLVAAASVSAVLAFGPAAPLVVGAAAVVVAAAVAGSLWQARRTQKTAAFPELGPEVTIDLRSPNAPRISSTDPVTGLVDQMHFRTTLSQRVASARRQLSPLSLVVFELDGFERARTERREQAMRLLGSVLRRTMRESDIGCRFGEAMVATLLEDTPEAGAAVAAERMRRALGASSTGRTFTMSVGVACYPSHALDAHELLRRSVRALATAKAAGRDRVEIAGGD